MTKTTSRHLPRLTSLAAVTATLLSIWALPASAVTYQWTGGLFNPGIIEIQAGC